MIYFDSKFSLEGTGSCYQLDPLVLIKPIRFSDEVLIRMMFYCWLLPETTKVSKKTKKNFKKNSLKLVSSLVCARIGLWSDMCALETASDQTVQDRSDLWSDRPRTKWPLIRQVPDHCPDKSALKAFSRPCNSIATGTCVRLKLVWSGVTWVWPPRPGKWRFPGLGARP